MNEHKIDNTATALAHIEAYMNGGDELGEVPEADVLAALQFLRQSLAPATDARLAEIEARQNHAKTLDLFFEANILIKQDIPYLLAELKRLRAPQPVTEPATGAAAETGSYAFELPIEKQLRQELAALQEQYRAAMGNLIARKLDLAEARREAEALRKGLRRLLRDLDRAGITKAFDMAVFGELNDSLNEAWLLVQEEKGDKK
jgi:hypothetical protein